MAEIIGLVASVASLIAFTCETSKACHKLVQHLASFKNAQLDIQTMRAELMDLAQILELLESVLELLSNCEIGTQGNVDLIERSLVRLRAAVQAIADLMIAAQPNARVSTAKARVKWVYKKDDVASMMAIIDRQRQALLSQLQLLSLKIEITDLEDSRKHVKEIESRLESLTAILTTSTWESSSRIEGCIQTSTTSLESSIRDQIRNTLSSIPRESSISQASLHKLSLLVSNIVATRSVSLIGDNPLNHPKRQPFAEDDGTQQRSAQDTARHSQKIVDCSHNQRHDYLYSKGISSRLTSQNSVQTMTSFFGTVVIRRSTVKLTFSGFDPDFFSERAKVEIDFFPARWVRSWTGCGMFLARMGFGVPRFDFSIAVARVVDFRANLDFRHTLNAIKAGDIDTLKGLLQRKVTYPTDRNCKGKSLLHIAASLGQIEVCELFLQQGAAVDVNTPSFFDDTYPIEEAIWASIRRDDRYLVRLFLEHGADTTMIDNSGRSVAAAALYYSSDEPQTTGSLFRFLLESDPSFDIHQRDCRGRTLLMQARGQSRQEYEEIIRLGADAEALDGNQSTVLHHFLQTISDMQDYLFPPPSIFLDGGEILALLIRAGADPLKSNSFGATPIDYFGQDPWCHRPRNIEKRINLAFWHQALRICGLSGARYCTCQAHHHPETIPQQDSDSRHQSRLSEFDRSLQFETFEDEMSAALRRRDRCLAQDSALQNKFARAWVKEVLDEVQVRQRNISSDLHAAAYQSSKGNSKSKEQDSIGSDETQSLDQLGCKTSPSTSRGSDSDEMCWTGSSSSSSSSEDEWESAPET